jgi:hypothetical protein
MKRLFFNDQKSDWKYNFDIKMAEGVVDTVSSEGLLIESNVFTKNASCVKCLRLETQLQETLNELSRVRLIIELIGKDKHSMSLEQVETICIMSSQIRQYQEEKNNNWELVT